METGVNDRSNRTMMTNPTNFLDTSGNKETVEVGVIVIGLCCICLVACALVILQLRSNNRRIMGNRQRSTDNESRDQTRDPLDIAAPPSYDAVIRSPHLYPPSRRNSFTLDASETRRSSDFSAFSLTLQSPRFIHQPRRTPRELCEDNQSLHSDTQLAGNQAENTEEPPPPYPGNDVLLSPRNARSMDYICHGYARPAGQRTRNRENELEGRSQNIRCCSDGRRGRPSLSQGNIACPSRNHVVNAWSDTQRGTSRNQRNEGCGSHECHSNPSMRNLVVNQSDQIASRTFVSHSARGSKEAVSTTRTFIPENLQDVETL